ncbi:MAG: FliA/WhiG family RNA polymerase sigma factor [Ilumatobacteraceae bacterium]|nr:MAG: FliA/WhiG family RNA polymerase sigma factor [Actinomycetota bacterium]
MTPALAVAWERWHQSAESSAREQLIVHYSPLVKFVAGRVGAGLPSSVDTGDLVSAGVFGLIDAIERFDPSRGAKFETFAIPRIRGAILDGLRALDWVPRSVRSRARLIEAAISKLEATLHRAPTDEEIAIELRVGPEEFQKWLAAVSIATVGPLDHLVGSSTVEPRPLHGDDFESPPAVIEETELRELMRAELKRLPERERTVIALYYDEGLTLAEIGNVLGVTESRVSQIHTKAVLMLRTRLTGAGM